MTYRSYIIERKPRLGSLLDWRFCNEDGEYCGRADSCDDAMSQIDAIIEEGE